MLILCHYRNRSIKTILNGQKTTFCLDISDSSALLLKRYFYKKMSKYWRSVKIMTVNKRCN